jgi:Domain of Unknown Function with PDB structure (DUF3857)
MTTLVAVLGPAFAQEGGQKPPEAAEKVTKEKAAPEKSASKPELPFQIQVLETHIRFEVNGDSRKEVHTIVKINNILGAHEFARLAFDYNRAFQQVEIPLVRVRHANGGTSELLPSAVVDAPNPAVEKFPAYQDVRVKSVRILGLQEGDTIEYRVITTTAKHPLAPDFWLEHTFDRSGQVLEEIYELDLPGSQQVDVRINPATPATKIDTSKGKDSSRTLYKWERRYVPAGIAGTPADASSESTVTPDIALSTFHHWRFLSVKLADALTPGATVPDPSKSREEQFQELRTAPKVPEVVLQKAKQLIGSATGDAEKTRAIYDFVSTKIETVDLPLGATGFSVRPADEILRSGYGTQEDKFVLFDSLAKAAGLGVSPILTGFSDVSGSAIARPSVFRHLDIWGGGPHYKWWMDPSLEVAPLGLVTPIKEKFVFRLLRANHIYLENPNALIDSSFWLWKEPPKGPSFPEFQRVSVNAAVTPEGNLTAKVKYTLRGDNELLLRVAFHQTAMEKWKDVAGLLAISDGFRGQVTSVNVSDPMATKDPFTVEYEITQAKFVDWSKKPVRIPALLPQIGLPDPPTRQPAGEAPHAIELGTPLDVDTQMTLRLPAGTVVQTPAGTSVDRDYAIFTSKYSTAANTVTASRRVNFLLREIPGDRALDYSTFLRAVQSDQAQMIAMVGAVAASNDAKPAKVPLKQ